MRFLILSILMCLSLQKIQATEEQLTEYETIYKSDFICALRDVGETRYYLSGIDKIQFHNGMFYVLSYMTNDELPDVLVCLKRLRASPKGIYFILKDIVSTETYAESNDDEYSLMIDIDYMDPMLRE